MHRGVREFVSWIQDNRNDARLDLNPPATSAQLAGLEQMIGEPVPTDLRIVLTTFNGGTLPTGGLLPAGIEPGTMGAAAREYASQSGKDFLDPELLLPFYHTPEDSLLAFDRSAGPVSDTWPIIDYYEGTGEERLMYHTFDGWCRNCVAEWTAEDFSSAFDLNKYLTQGQRHVREEPGVATAHATVAHAWRRAGEPEKALASYLRAARCVPPLNWCDWEALKIATLLDRPRDALDAATRLCARAPKHQWPKRETTPGRVAETIALVAVHAGDRAPWIRLLDQLVEQSEGEDLRITKTVRSALQTSQPPPRLRAFESGLWTADETDPELRWKRARQAYSDGTLRDEDLLLRPEMQELGPLRKLSELLRIRREFT